MTETDLALVRHAMWRLYEGVGGRNIEILRALDRVEDTLNGGDGVVVTKLRADLAEARKRLEQREKQEAYYEACNRALIAVPPYVRTAALRASATPQQAND